MRPIIISMVTVPSKESREFLSAKTFEPDANLSPVDKPPKTITELKSDTLREKRIQEWKFAQNIKLEQSILTKRQKEIEQAGRRWWTGQVVAVALVAIGESPMALAGADEKELLNKLFSLLSTKYQNHRLVAKGGGDFAIPFLIGRAISYDMGLPPQLLSTYPINDIHALFGRSSQSLQRGNIEDYSYSLNLKVKDKDQESGQFLFDQYLLGNEKALDQMKFRCAEEAMIIAEMLRRADKPFKAQLEPDEQKDTPVEVPF